MQSASHEYNSTSGLCVSAFDKNEEEWQTTGGTFSSGALAVTTITNGIGAGVWIQLEMPYKIILKKWAIRQRNSQLGRHIKNAFLVGTNDGHGGILFKQSQMLLVIVVIMTYQQIFCITKHFD